MNSDAAPQPHDTGPAPSSSPAGPPLRVGMVGAGFIAREMMQAARVVDDAEIVAVTSARPASAAAFAAEHGVPHAYPTLEHMLRAGRRPGEEIDLVYVASPNVLHAEHTIAALEAGYHVLVEKPFALHPHEAEAMIAAARRADRFLMEAWLTAVEPGTAVVRRALERVLDDGPGPHQAVLVRAQFSSRMERLRAGDVAPAFDPALGGGSLMDLGTYPVSLAVHLLGEPARVSASASLLGTGADSHGTVVLGYDRLPDGRATDLQVVCLHSKTSPAPVGNAVVSDRLVLSFDSCQWPRRVSLTGPQSTRELVVPGADDDAPALARELAEVAGLVRRGQRQSPQRPWEESLAVVRVLARARSLSGVRVPGDA